MLSELRKLGETHSGAGPPEPTSEQLEALHQLEDKLIREVVQRQVDIGLDVVTDGEFKRVFFTGAFDTAVTGLRPSTGVQAGYNDQGLAFTQPGAPVIAERLRLVNNPLVEEARILGAVAGRRFKLTLPAASIYQWPGHFLPGVTDQVYCDHDEVADHVAQILRALVDGAVASGASHIQCDFPLYPLFVDRTHYGSLWRETMGVCSDGEFLDRLLRADRAVVEGLPDHVLTALHVCRGNFPGAWYAEGSLEPVAERVFNELPYDRFLLELDDKEHHGDYSQLRHMPKGKVAVLGIVSTHSPEVGTEDDLLHEIEEASRYLGIEQLALSPQCGFATRIAEPGIEATELQWRKLELVVRVADRVWPR
jgi:5-methyltetrahydropteroyltriglutamate--homocysteine methyltransferase